MFAGGTIRMEIFVPTKMRGETATTPSSGLPASLGRMALWEHSAFLILVQCNWLAAVQSPPHLKAMIPAMTFSTPRNFFYAGGTWDMSWIEWLWDNIAWDTARKRTCQVRTYEEALATWKEEGA